MAKNIIQLKFDSSNIYDIRPYAECTTEANTPDKAITTLTGFATAAGAVVVIKFAKGNTVNNMKLNINGTTKNVSTQNLIIDKGDVVEFIYNGSTWDVIGGAGCSNTDIEGLFKE